jgi:tetratricopeptide (TPR) repeat protein
VRHIHATLGKYYGRSHKYCAEKKGKRVVCCQKSDTKAATKHLEKAIELLPDRKQSALNNITHNRISTYLADCYMKSGDLKKATDIMNRTVKYFEENKIKKEVLDEYKQQITKAKSGKKAKKEAEVE